MPHIEPVMQVASKPSLVLLSIFAAGGMIVCSILGVEHFYAANYSAVTFQSEFCDINRHWNCSQFDYSPGAHIAGVPLAYCGLVVGLLIFVGPLIPSKALERTQRTMVILNVVIFTLLVSFWTIHLKSVCLIGVSYWVFAVICLIVFARSVSAAEVGGGWAKWLRPAPRVLAVIVILAALGSYGFASYTQVMEENLADRAVDQYSRLATVSLPSLLSPYWVARSSEHFEDAPIQVVEFDDLLCDDAVSNELVLDKLKEDFKGKINVVWQFFPLEAMCNQVVKKDKHPGACDAAYMAAYQPSKFLALHDEFIAHWKEASKPEWRTDLARRYGVEDGITDKPTQELVHKIIQTATEYQPTSVQYSYGIRSVPTLIVNNRLIIGIFSYPQLHAIFQRIVDEKENKIPRFIENWRR
jgi:uncharacterized membrane protein